MRVLTGRTVVRRLLGLGTLLAVVVAALAATGASAENGASRKTIDVGNITAVTNLGGTFTGFQAGVKAFFSYYNANGGLSGYKVNLTTLDDAGDPGRNAAAARQLVEQNKVVAIVGQATVADAASQKYLQGKGIPVVGGWAASSSYHKPASNMFVSLEGPNIPYCPLWSSDQAKARGIKKIAFIAQDFPAAIQDAECRSAAAKYLGMRMAGKIGKASLTAVDYRPIVQQAIKDGADAIYFSTGTDGQVKGIVAGEQLGYKGLYVATQFGASLFSGLTSAGLEDKVSGRVISAAFSLLPDDPDTYGDELRRAKAGLQKYQPKFKDDVTAISGWAAGKLFADALAAVGPDGKKMIGWISKQKRYTYGGLQGPMDYSTGSKPNQCLTQLQWKGGRVVRDVKAARAPGFDCGDLISYDGKRVLFKKPISVISATSSSAKPLQVGVIAKDFSFALTTKKIPLGRPVEFTLTNAGPSPHDFDIEGAKGTPIIAAGKKATFTVTFGKPGTYRYVCTVPRHAQFGMVGDIKVG